MGTLQSKWPTSSCLFSRALVTFSAILKLWILLPKRPRSQYGFGKSVWNCMKNDRAAIIALSACSEFMFQGNHFTSQVCVMVLCLLLVVAVLKQINIRTAASHLP